MQHESSAKTSAGVLPRQPVFKDTLIPACLGLEGALGILMFLCAGQLGQLGAVLRQRHPAVQLQERLLQSVRAVARSPRLRPRQRARLPATQHALLRDVPGQNLRSGLVLIEFFSLQCSRETPSGH